MTDAPPTIPEQLLDLTLTVNGTAYPVRVPGRRLLSDCLRHDLGLTGTHVGCEHGVCGACTVLLDGVPVRSCLILAATAEGQQITTVEGLAPGSGTSGTSGVPETSGVSGVPEASGVSGASGASGVSGASVHLPSRDPEPALSPVQRAFRDSHALQCGFCTPGFLTTVTAFLDEVPDPTPEQAREAIAGNLCRCTGYQNIVTAVLRAAELRREEASR